MDSSDRLIDAALAGVDDDVEAVLRADPDAARASIHAAAALGDVAALAALLESDPTLADRRGGRREWTPLLYLCCGRYGRRDAERMAARIRIARHLLQRVDVNAVGREPGYDDREWRPLAGAAGPLASLELVRLLVWSGASIGKTDEVLSHAVRGGNVDVLRLLLELAPRDWYQLIWAAQACVRVDRIDMARSIAAHVEAPTQLEPALREAIRLERGPEWIDALLVQADTASGRALAQEVYRNAFRHGQRASADFLRNRGADDAMLASVDRALGACMTGDRAALGMHLAGEKRLVRVSRDDQRLLAHALRTVRHRSVALLLEVGLAPDAPDDEGERPLHLAVRSRAPELVDVLLRAGAAVNGLDFEGRTPLDLARTLEDEGVGERIMRRLEEAGAVESRPVPDRAARDALFEHAADAVAAGEVHALRALLDEHPGLVHARSPRPHRGTLLIYCAANGTEDPRQRTPPNAPEIARLLLERGSDPNATCKLYGGGWSTMGLMLTSAHPPAAGVDGELARVLLAFGATLDTSELMGAIEYGLQRSVQAYADAGAPVENLFVAAGLGRVDALEALLARGADVDARLWRHGTALHAAAALGREEAVRFLLARGADTRPRNVWQSTPADTARFFGHAKLAELMERA